MLDATALVITRTWLHMRGQHFLHKLTDAQVVTYSQQIHSLREENQETAPVRFIRSGTGPAQSLAMPGVKDGVFQRPPDLA